MSILSFKRSACPTMIYVIAESREAAEGLVRRYVLRSASLKRMAVDRAAVIHRWRRMPERMKTSYHVYGIRVLTTDDATIVSKTVRLALKYAAAFGLLMIVVGLH